MGPPTETLAAHSATNHAAHYRSALPYLSHNLRNQFFEIDSEESDEPSGTPVKAPTHLRYRVISLATGTTTILGAVRALKSTSFDRARCRGKSRVPAALTRRNRREPV